jgi:hypothetical protein
MAGLYIKVRLGSKENGRLKPLQPTAKATCVAWIPADEGRYCHSTFPLKRLHKKQRYLDADERGFSFCPRSSAFVRVQSNEFGFGLSELGCREFIRQVHCIARANRV